ncbi:MAG: hypothetical protein WB699_06400 [Bacteroidota bacterium]
MTDDEERIQKTLNEAKKRELEERYGGSFHPADSELPPEVEADWLQSIEEFERIFENAEVTTVRKFLGNPYIAPLAEIPDDRIGRELDRVIDLLEDQGIVIHFCAPIPDEEAYRFISEELLEMETDDIHVDGLTQDYVYEEFHPNDVLDASFSGEILLRGIFTSPREELLEELVPDGTDLKTGGRVSRAELFQPVEDIRRGIVSYLRFKVTICRCRVTGSEGSVAAHLLWEGLREGTLKQVSGGAEAQLGLQKDENGYWRVCALAIHQREA